jgi:hypothetical protein
MLKNAYVFRLGTMEPNRAGSLRSSIYARKANFMREFDGFVNLLGYFELDKIARHS